MSLRIIWWTALATALLAIGAVRSAAAERETEAPAAATVARPSRPLTPEMTEIRGVLDREREVLAALEARFARAADHKQALAIQREIEQTKIGTELEVLRVQARHARREGRIKTADQIEATIEAMLHPDPSIRRAPPRESVR